VLNLRVAHTQNERLRPVSRPQLGVVEWPRVPNDLNENEREPDGVSSRTGDTEEAPNAM
jgi:hypothetical protein